MRLANNTGGTTYDTTTTGGGGGFVLFTNTASAQLRIYETNAAGYLSVSYNFGTTGGAYTIGGEYIQFAYALYTDYADVLFGDVPNNTFLPTPLRRTQLDGLVGLLRPHLYARKRRHGQLLRFQQDPATPGRPVYYRDVNCNGTYDAAISRFPRHLLPAPARRSASWSRTRSPPAISLGTTDQIVTRATFTFTNSVGPRDRHLQCDRHHHGRLARSSVTVSGMVYNDANHNGMLDGGEDSPNLAGIYAKLFRSSDLVSALSVTSVGPGRRAPTRSISCRPTTRTPSS